MSSSGSMTVRRFLNRVMNRVVARAPATWPLFRRWQRRFWNGMARGWDDRVGGRSVDHLAPLAAALLHVEPEPERALDIGTGTGAGALLIAREFPRARVRGVDLSEEMIRLATDRVGLDPEGRIAFKVADASDLPYEDESFDLVTLLNMPPFFAEIARVLRPGGTVAVASSWGERTPFHTPESVLRRGFGRLGLEPLEAEQAGEGEFFVARLPG